PLEPARFEAPADAGIYQGALACLVVQADFGGEVGRRIFVGNRREQVVATIRRAKESGGVVKGLALFCITQSADQRQLWCDLPFTVRESRVSVGALAIIVPDGVKSGQAKEGQQIERIKFIMGLHLVPRIKGSADQREVVGVIGQPYFLRILVDLVGVGAIEENKRRSVGVFGVQT